MLKFWIINQLPDSEPYNDQEILKLVASGDEHAFAILYHHYYQLLYPFLLRFADTQADVDEMLQETFIRVWLARDKLTDIENFRAWIFKVSSRENLTYLRNQLHNRKKASRLQASGQSTTETNTPFNDLHLAEIKELIREAIDQMPEQRRKIYQLSRDKGLKAGEIAERLSISPNTVQNVLTSALKDIRAHLAKAGHVIPMIILMIGTHLY